VSQAHFGSTVPGKNSAFWKYCSRKKQRILEVLFPEKNVSAYRGRALKRSRWPNLTFFFFFLFPGIVLPFFQVQYFHFVIFP
jgi:hypothetical protein